MDLLSRGTVEEVRTVVRERIESWGITAAIASVPAIPSPYVKVENYIAMIEETMRGYL